ncbi:MULTISPECIES: hypothetical protein [unclassified Moorena]|uniref:hypothetical protein n=1 Tax=unclassified Moorena TaxID=2683338 RepID=UPI001401A828|nr:MULTISPECIES: hypothetical protein [unclassified Moorena]NEO17574.1 hypothetical protein [Moorena sp. SIO3E8]NEQ04113.1 hypothetical protein [Moorena sp. SIO3F7]
MVNDPPETMDSDSLYERSPVIWRRSQIGRPGKEDGAMEIQPLNHKCIKTFLETRHMRTAGVAGIVCGASVRPENPA